MCLSSFTQSRDRWVLSFLAHFSVDYRIALLLFNFFTFDLQKEYLIQLVKKLRNRVRDLSETNSSRTSSVTGDIHQDCR